MMRARYSTRSSPGSPRASTVLIFGPRANFSTSHLGIILTSACAPSSPHCHLGLGKLYRRTGQREQAHEHLTTATTMYREMGMTYWLEQAEAEMRASE